MKPSNAKSWKEKIVVADQIWSQVKQALQAAGASMPLTPRRPDVRLILNNVSGLDQIFRNPGDHSSKAEHVPAAGDKTAAMVMIKGDTLTDQYDNAGKLMQRYKLAEEGLSSAFVQALQSGEALDLVREAYGPAPFEGQAGKLVEVSWKDANGKVSTIVPQRSLAAAFGARAADKETAFLSEMVIFVKGSTTTPELVENAGMVIAVSQDWQTGAETTKPIALSVAKEFYGEHYAAIPVVSVHPDGHVQSIDLKNGTIINLDPPQGMAVAAANPA